MGSNTHRTRLTVGSLFSGIGGFDLGLERAGMNVKWQVEIDEYCQRVLAKHWPDVPRFKDATHAGRSNLPAVDVLCGGFPCQDLSVAGRRAGLSGKQSGLWWQFHRIIDEIRPKWVVIENVPGLLSSNEGRDMATLLHSLGELGYWWSYRILDAQYSGVPQRRRRVFIVGHSGERPAPATVLFEPESRGGDTPPRRKAGQGVAGTLGGGAGTRGWADDTDRMTAVSAGAGGSKFGSGRNNQDTFVAHTLSSEGSDASEDGTGRGVPLVSFTNRAHVADGVTETVRADSNGALPMVARAMAVRRLTPLECCRLQGLPDDWLDLEPPLLDSAKYRMVGNAVAVPVAQWIGERIMESANG